jgi:hypothetical protein
MIQMVRNQLGDSGVPPFLAESRWLVGRGERIRTSDLLVPNQALYQAEPRPDAHKVTRS